MWPTVRTIVGSSLLVLAFCACAARASQPPGPPRDEKSMRTPAQQKIDSQVLYEIYRRRGIAREKGVPEGKTDVRIDRDGRALVDIRAVVTPAIEKKVTSLGSTIVETSGDHHSIVAWVPLLKIERLAEDAAVRFVMPKAEPAIK